MTQIIKPLIAGNWKMNGLKAALSQLERLAGLVGDDEASRCDVAICPPATLVALAAETLSETPISVGGQDCHAEKSGAHTGDVSAEMLKDAGAHCVIVGHSERRADHGETDAIVAAKAAAAMGEGLIAIVCVGETATQREKGEAVKVGRAQLQGSLPPDADADKLVVAYEPVWAIGTGLTPTLDDILEIHSEIRAVLVQSFGEAGARIAILYGGSMKPANAAGILALENVNGGLVGGASLKAEDFIGIIRAV